MPASWTSYTHTEQLLIHIDVGYAIALPSGKQTGAAQEQHREGENEISIPCFF